MDDEALRAAITARYRADEPVVVGELLAEWDRVRPAESAVREPARRLVEAVRAQRAGASGVDHLMQEFSLSSQEGIALMCLAEALLRIPDAATADRLIRDKLAGGNWRAHLGGSPSLFVNAATWGLMITGKLAATHSSEGLGNALTRLIARSGEPVIRAGVDFAMRLLGQQFVMGETIGSALLRSEGNEAHGYAHSFDMLGEAALTSADADRYFASYRDAIERVGNAARTRRRDAHGQSFVGISIKLSALHPRYVRSQRARVMAELLPQLVELMALAKSFDIAVNIDAEEADRLDLSLDLFAALAFEPRLAGWAGLGFVVQAYQKRAPQVIDWLLALARAQGRRFPVRLVKGAYWDSEIKRAQEGGHAGYPVFTRKAHSDLCYLVCAARMLAAPDAIYAQFATHNAHTLATVDALAARFCNGDFEFQCLHGMGEPLYDNVVGNAAPARHCRIYAPVGSHETLLPYLVRRLLENGANSSFVNRIVDPAVAIGDLLVDPAGLARASGGAAHPAIALPIDLLPGRRNSRGVDFSDEAALAALHQVLTAQFGRHFTARPQIHYPTRETSNSSGGGTAPGVRKLAAETLTVVNPADATDVVGIAHAADGHEIEAALAAAAEYAPTWHAMPAARRAALLEHAADLLEAERETFFALAIREAGKSWPNAVAEVREAVDFCRSYAAQARHLPAALPAPGVALCISPWNFPLAIFLGQIAAALAAGSPVIAKPAEQTTLMAHAAVDLLHRAGVPYAAVQLLPGRGETVGAALVADPRIASVIFTGSTEVARLINRTLAARADVAAGGDVRLVAETGGQNAMIVDSTALLEQVVQDALASGFDSAGQRCSALRVLCLQDEIFERGLSMLKEAMHELVIGDPRLLDTDIGPVIDAEARAGIEAHVARMSARGARVTRLPLSPACVDGTFVAPTLIEIGALDWLEREVFGPVIHVLSFRADALDDLLARIAALGYGLTMGVHSRIDETVAQVAAATHVGNLYVNRNIVGAVVGVQPFGGEGLSGTGPKAGGPLYVPRLAGAHDVEAALVARDANYSGGGTAAVAAGSEWTLPGPTGERNTLRFVPRGNVLCLAADAPGLAAQLDAARASGNRPLIAVDCDPAPGTHADVPRLADAALAVAPIAAALCDLPAPVRAAWRRKLAAREGPLVACIDATGEPPRYPAWRLLGERVLCINTTAAGGNTALMTLEA